MRKYTRDDIARAYNTFDLPLGTPLVEVMVKYRKLAPVIHPDRFFDPAQKKKAEEKLKKLNHAKDVLNDHFKGPRASHVEGATCACRPAKAASFNPGLEQSAKKEAAKKAAEAAAKEAAKKAAEDALKKAAAEAEKTAAEKLRAEKNAAAKEAALKAAQAAAEAERLAAVAAAAAKEAAETVQADASHEQRKQSEAARWLCAKVCAAIFLGIMTFAGASDLVKGPGRRDRPVSSVTPSPATSPSETKEQEDSFYRMEADRSTSDEKHRYDAEVDQCLNQISDDEKQIRAWQQELDKLKKEPQSNDMAAIYALHQDIYTTSLRWKAASDSLDALVHQHPEIASERISNRPAPPAMEALEVPLVSPHWSPVQNHNQRQDTEKTRRHLI